MNLLNVEGLIFAAAVFIPLERLRPLRRQSLFRSGWRADIAHAVLTQLLVRAGLIGVTAVAMSVSAETMTKPLLTELRAQSLPMQIIEMLILGDLFYYVAHRLCHRVPLLWRYHAVHHGIEEMDWLAAYRSHPVDLVITKGAQYFPLFYLGFSPAALFLYSAIFSWHSFLLHANLRIDFGHLRWIIASPQFHHWHHANEPAARDKNFAAQLSLFDVIFGTWRCPSHSPGTYGTDDAVAKTYMAQMLHPWARTSQRH